MMEWCWKVIINCVKLQYCAYGFKNLNAYLPEIRYYVTAVFCKAKMFKNWEVMPYKPAYDVTIIFDKPYYGYTELTFSTKTDVALNEQIAVQLLAVQMNYDKNYKDF